MSASRLVLVYHHPGAAVHHHGRGLRDHRVSHARRGADRPRCSFAARADAPIAFDSSVPPPPRPTVTVTPDHDLAVPGRRGGARHRLHAGADGPRPGVLRGRPRGDLCARRGSRGDPGRRRDLRPHAHGPAPAVRRLRHARLRRRRHALLRPDRQRLGLRAGAGRPRVRPGPSAAARADRHGRRPTTTSGTSRPSPCTARASRPVAGCRCPSAGSRGVTYGASCKGLPELTADAAGNLSGSERVSRTLRDPSLIGGSRDCGSTSSSPCAARARDEPRPRRHRDRAAAVRPVVAAAAAAGRDRHPEPGPLRRPARDRGRRALRAEPVARCHRVPARREPLSGECDLSQLRLATTDADGAFSRRFVTKSVAVFPSGPLRLLERAGTLRDRRGESGRRPDRLPADRLRPAAAVGARCRRHRGDRRHDERRRCT